MFSRFPHFFGGLVTDKLEERVVYKRTAPAFKGIPSEEFGTELLDLPEVASFVGMVCYLLEKIILLNVFSCRSIRGTKGAKISLYRQFFSSSSRYVTS